MTLKLVNLSSMPLAADVVVDDICESRFDLKTDDYANIPDLKAQPLLDLSSPELHPTEITVLFLNDHVRSVHVKPEGSAKTHVTPPEATLRLQGHAASDYPNSLIIQLREASREEHLQATGKLYHVHAYMTDRLRGGPEEGGWYYDAGAFDACHGTFESKREAQALLDSMQPQLEEARQGRYPPSSVLCNGWPDLRIETHEGRDYPQRRPVYS